MRALVEVTNSSSEPIRIGSGQHHRGEPAIQHPADVMRPRLVGPRIATWSPGISPLACSAAPTARASSWTWRHGQATGSPSGITDAPTKRMPVGASAARSSRSMMDAGGSAVVVMGPS